MSLAGGLASVPGIHVAAPTANVSAGEDPQDTARRLDCNLLLSGAVRRAGYELRVTWTLTDPWRRHHVASDTVQGADSALFALEDRLLQSLRSALGVDGAEPMRPPGRRDPAADQRYQQALGYLKRADNEASGRRRDRHSRTADREAKARRRWSRHSSRAPISRSTCCRRIANGRPRRPEACERARRLDPDAPNVLVALGELHLGAPVAPRMRRQSSSAPGAAARLGRRHAGARPGRGHRGSP